jgi:hypothetical protein
MTNEISLIAEQDRLVVTLRKCEAHGRKGAFAARTAERRFTRKLESAGFAPLQAYAALCDARDVAELEAGK